MIITSGSVAPEVVVTDDLVTRGVHLLVRSGYWGFHGSLSELTFLDHSIRICTMGVSIQFDFVRVCAQLVSN